MNSLQKNIRKHILDYSFTHQCEHIPSALSQCDYLYALFNIINPYNYNILMGKFYGAQGVYVPLYLNNHIKSLDNLSYFINANELPFTVQTVDTIADTIGFASGMALGGISNIIVNSSDAVFQSGYTYEALNFINQHNLNILILVDNNNFQVCDKIKNISSIEPIKNMIKAMHNFAYYECDGHNINLCKYYLNKMLFIKGPRIIFFNTIKGCGVSEMENNDKWHYKKLTKDDYDEFIKYFVN